MDTRRGLVHARAVDAIEVGRAWQEIEREVAVARCGEDAAKGPREALLELKAKLGGSEGDTYTTKLTGWQAIGQRLTVALAERYGLMVFRYKGQRRGTIMLRGPETFVEEIFMPLMEQLNVLVVRQVDAWLTEVIDTSVSDFKPKPPKQLELGSG